jgi:hypothetical protein
MSSMFSPLVLVVVAWAILSSHVASAKALLGLICTLRRHQLLLQLDSGLGLVRVARAGGGGRGKLWLPHQRR